MKARGQLGSPRIAVADRPYDLQMLGQGYLGAPGLEGEPELAADKLCAEAAERSGSGLLAGYRLDEAMELVVELGVPDRFASVRAGTAPGASCGTR